MDLYVFLSCTYSFRQLVLSRVMVTSCTVIPRRHTIRCAAGTSFLCAHVSVRAINEKQTLHYSISRTNFEWVLRNVKRTHRSILPQSRPRVKPSRKVGVPGPARTPKGVSRHHARSGRDTRKAVGARRTWAPQNQSERARESLGGVGLFALQGLST